MKYFLAVKFVVVFLNKFKINEMIHWNKNPSTPAQKIDSENSLQQSFASLSKLLTVNIYV